LEPEICSNDEDYSEQFENLDTSDLKLLDSDEEKVDNTDLETNDFSFKAAHLTST
jgi:hypothetical protein